jgi:hypothetical protein
MNQYNDNSIFNKNILVSSVDVPTHHKESSVLEAKNARLVLDLGFRCLNTFINRGIKTCSSYFSPISFVLSL